MEIIKFTPPETQKSPQYEHISRNSFSRRRILQLAGLSPFLLAGLSVNSKPSEKQIGYSNEWTQAQVEELGQSMRAEPRYNYIAYAGSILLDNQQGKPSFSTMSSMFSDKKVRITNVSYNSGLGVYQPPMDSKIEFEPTITVSVQSKSGGTDQLIVPRGLYFDELQINRGLTKDYSEFLFNFIVAKEVMNVSAFDMVSSYYLDKVFSSQYELPSDGETKNELQASIMRDGGDYNISTGNLADIWAHCLMVPNYLLALDDGKFNPNEANGDVLSLMKSAAKYFLDRGVLIKTNDTYEWTKDSDKYFNAYFDFSELYFDPFQK